VKKVFCREAYLGRALIAHNMKSSHDIRVIARGGKESN
jgi:hypothetical protein